MFQKTCLHCGKKSYSAFEGREWICPHCGEDISNTSRYTVQGMFRIDVEASNEQEAREIASRILQTDGIGYSIVEVQGK